MNILATYLEPAILYGIARTFNKNPSTSCWDLFSISINDQIYTSTLHLQHQAQNTDGTKAYNKVSIKEE